MPELDPTAARAYWEEVYEILITCCGASELTDEREEFLSYMAVSVKHGHEFRFGGWLGFGGKLYANTQGVYVDCYAEQKSPIVAFAIRVANERIAALSAGEPEPAEAPGFRVEWVRAAEIVKGDVVYDDQDAFSEVTGIGTWEAKGMLGPQGPSIEFGREIDKLRICPTYEDKVLRRVDGDS
jgi:hypothetical protein